MARYPLTLTVFAVLSAGLPALAAPPPAAKQTLTVFDVGAPGQNEPPTYVVYDIPSLKLKAYTGYYSFANTFGNRNGTVYFADEGNMYSFKAGRGAITPTLLFGAPNAGSVVVDGRKHIYAIDNYKNTVDEYTDTPLTGGGTKTPIRTIPLAPNDAGLLKIDAQNNLWVAYGNTVLVFGPTGTTPIATFTYTYGVRDITVDPAGAVWVLYNGVGITFSGGCTIDPKGTITRYQVMSKYVNLQDVSDFYSEPFDTNPPAHVAVDTTGRVYYSAQPEIVDYDPGAQCPNDSLLISNLVFYANATLAIDANNNFYAGIAEGANTISVYAPASTTPVKVLTQTISGGALQLAIQ